MNGSQREAMPRPDPLPRPPASHADKLRRGLKLLAGFALVVALLATLLVARGQVGFHIHMLIATFAGMGLAVFIGGVLMLLIFYSAASGHDEAASRYDSENKE